MRPVIVPVRAVPRRGFSGCYVPLEVPGGTGIIARTETLT